MTSVCRNFVATSKKVQGKTKNYGKAESRTVTEASAEAEAEAELTIRGNHQILCRK